MKIKPVFIFSLCLCLLGCSDKTRQENFIGAWYFIDGDSYYELHFNENHMLLHNELTGSKINKYKLVGNIIQVLNNEEVVEENKIIKLSDENGTITMQGRTVDVQRLDTQFDIGKILEGEDMAYKNFTKQFNQRQSKYLDQVSL